MGLAMDPDEDGVGADAGAGGMMGDGRRIPGTRGASSGRGTRMTGEGEVAVEAAAAVAGITDGVGRIGLGLVYYSGVYFVCIHKRRGLCIDTL